MPTLICRANVEFVYEVEVPEELYATAYGDSPGGPEYTDVAWVEAIEAVDSVTMSRAIALTDALGTAMLMNFEWEVKPNVDSGTATDTGNAG